MKAPTVNRPARAADTQPWLPLPQAARTLDLGHWQSRAARGHSWNAGATMRRRRSH